MTLSRPSSLESSQRLDRDHVEGGAGELAGLQRENSASSFTNGRAPS